MLKWTNQGTSDLVLDRVNNLLGVNEKGEVTLGWGPRVFESAAEILAGCITYSPDLSESRRVAITRRALIDAKKAGDFSHKGVLDRASHQQTEFLRSPIQPYVLVSSASIEYHEYLAPVTLPGVTISFLEHRPSKFVLPVNQGQPVEHNVPFHQTHVTVEVAARDPLEAADVAFSHLTLLRGIWNLFLNRRTEMRISFGGGHGRHPVNQIVPGPLHSVHQPDGGLALNDRWWVSPDLEGIRPAPLSQAYKPLKEFERTVRNRLNNAAIGTDLTRLLTLYCGACDEPQLSSSYLSLWAVLEQITGTAKASYEDLLRRASFFSIDPLFDRAVLEYLRNQRNGMVHHGSSIDDPERIVYQLKHYVEYGLTFLLRNARRFRTVEEFRQLMDLPPDTELLRERLKLDRWAYGMHAKWRKAADPPVDSSKE